MKTSIVQAMTLMSLVFLMVHPNFASAQTVAATIPSCDENQMVTPCILAAKDTASAIAEMLFANALGFKSVNEKAQVGFEVDDVRVTFMSEVTNNRDGVSPRYLSQIKYELLLKDCRGTDACMGSYVWTVIEDIQGDGYTSRSSYKDTLITGNALPLNK